MLVAIAVALGGCTTTTTVTTTVTTTTTTTTTTITTITETYPQISFNADVWDLGSHPGGIYVYHDLIIYNTGDADLTISSINAPCGCTIIGGGDYPLVLAPGESHTVNVSFRTAGYSGMVTKSVYITSDDPDRPQVQLVFTCNVLTGTTTTTQTATTTVTTTTPLTTTTTTHFMPTGTPTTTPSQSPPSVIVVLSALTASVLLLFQRRCNRGGR